VRVVVQIVPNARGTRVEPQGDGTLRVAVTAPPREGRANAALVEALASHFRVPRSRVQIVRGHTSRRKIVEIDGAPPARRPT
jgi:uncharacterized protein (TIGR00251 family)